MGKKSRKNVNKAHRAMTEVTSNRGALAHRLAKQSLPLRRAQRGGTKG